MAAGSPAIGEDEAPFEWEALFHSAQTFAQASVDNYSVQDAAFFFLHAGASVELGIKAALCRVSPVLLIEGGNRFSDHALISLMGLRAKTGPDATGQTRTLFTVGFDQAIKRFVTLHGKDALGVSYDDVQALKAARDVTAHGGRVSDATSQTLLKTLITMSRVHASLASLLCISLEEFWGSSYNLVLKASQEHKGQARHEVQTLLSAAQVRFQKAYGDMDPDTIGEVLRRAGDKVEPGEYSWYRNCPVCGATGLSKERAAQRSVIRRGKVHVERGWMASDFRCSICRLYLPSEELVQAAVDFDFDPWHPADDELMLGFWYEDMGLAADDGDEDGAKVLEG